MQDDILKRELLINSAMYERTAIKLLYFYSIIVFIIAVTLSTNLFFWFAALISTLGIGCCIAIHFCYSKVYANAFQDKKSTLLQTILKALYAANISVMVIASILLLIGILW